MTVERLYHQMIFGKKPVFAIRVGVNLKKKGTNFSPTLKEGNNLLKNWLYL